MPGRKYSLDPLLKLRERQVEDATRELAKAVSERQAAEKKRAEAELVQKSADERAHAVRREEDEALARGELRAADLHRAQAWEFGVREQRKQLSQHVAVAAEGQARAVEVEVGARTTLVTREADAEVVEKDKARFVAREAKRENEKEEESAAEASAVARVESWRPRRA